MEYRLFCMIINLIIYGVACYIAYRVGVKQTTKKIPHVIDTTLKRLEFMFNIENNKTLQLTLEQQKSATIFNVQADLAKWAPFTVVEWFQREYPADARVIEIRESGGNFMGYELKVISKEFEKNGQC
jgi:hypothetical protein